MLGTIGAILVFGIIILIHELGHFLLAKLNGIGVIEFSIGMGPRLLSFERGETRYSLKLLPFGGSCMMLGEDEQDSDEKAFNNKSVWARISVIAAGPIFNFVLAFIAAVILVSAVGVDYPIVSELIDGFPAQEAGLQPGDEIVRINRSKIYTYNDIQMYLIVHPGEPYEITVKRMNAQNQPEKFTTTLVPKYSETDGTYLMGLRFDATRKPVDSIGGILLYAANEVESCITSTIQAVGMLFRNQIELEDSIAGPIRIVSMVGGNIQQGSEYGLLSVLLTICNWCVLLSASLGFMNLLPIPALDGGRLVFLIIEAFRGKPIDREKEGMIHMVGMMFLMGLMVLVLFNDIRSFF